MLPTLTRRSLARAGLGALALPLAGEAASSAPVDAGSPPARWSLPYVMEGTIQLQCGRLGEERRSVVVGYVAIVQDGGACRIELSTIHGDRWLVVEGRELAEG